MNLKGTRVLVTGGTKGLGKAIGIEFARAGATVCLTHRWGSVTPEELVAEFRSIDLPAPSVHECDVSDPEANRALLKEIEAAVGGLDVIVSNVAFSKIVAGLGDLKKSTLDLSLGYSAWPVVDLAQASQEVFGRFPKYILGISSDGGEVCHAGYDFAGVSKAALETLCRYLALRLKEHGTRVNAVRPGFLDTDSSRATFGEDCITDVKSRLDGFMLDPRSVARTCVALCSGYMDSVTGQVIVVDEGWTNVSPFALLTGKGIPKGFPDGR